MPDLSAFLANVFSMLPDMGRYAVYVWSSYAITGLVLGALFAMSLISWNRTTHQLKEKERNGKHPVKSDAANDMIPKHTPARAPLRTPHCLGRPQVTEEGEDGFFTHKNTGTRVRFLNMDKTIEKNLPKNNIFKRMTYRKKQRLVLALFSTLLVGGSVTLSLVALKDTIVFFYSPSDLKTRSVAQMQRVRLGGLVKEGSMQSSGPGYSIYCHGPHRRGPRSLHRHSSGLVS